MVILAGCFFSLQIQVRVGKYASCHWNIQELQFHHAFIVNALTT